MSDEQLRLEMLAILKDLAAQSEQIKADLADINASMDRVIAMLDRVPKKPSD
jgi:uncharacterized protein YukE